MLKLHLRKLEHKREQIPKYVVPTIPPSNITFKSCFKSNQIFKRTYAFKMYYYIMYSTDAATYLLGKVFKTRM